MLLFVSGENEQACDALIEACAALAAGRQLFRRYSPGAPPFSHHPNCRNFSALADAIAAVMAMQAGEAARGYSTSISGTFLYVLHLLFLCAQLLHSRANFKGLWLRFNLLVTTRRA